MNANTTAYQSFMKFINFFINDMLDYSILKNSNAEFAQNIEFINIEEALKEILNLLAHKTQLKNIEVTHNFE